MKRLLSLFVALSLFNTVVYADSPLDTDTDTAVQPEISIEFSEPTFTEVPLSEIPEEALSFDSEEEAIEYFNSIRSDSNSVDAVALKNNNSYARAYQTALCNSINAGFGGKINLYVTCDVVNNKITSASPYTSFTGITFSYDWQQNSAGSTISTDRQRVDVYATGTLTGYVFISGIGNVYSENVYISGYAYLK